MDKELQNSVTSGPILKTILTLATPVVLNMLMEFALTTIDYYWVGKIGPTAQDVVTTSMVVIWTIFVLITIITIGVTAIVSRHVGAKDYEKAAFYSRQGISFAIYFALLLTVVGYLISPPLLSFMDAGEETFSLAVTYLRIFFFSAIFFFINDTIYSIFRASGDTRTPMVVGIITIVLNMILDPMLIFGIGPFPELGVAGASVATAISVAIGSLLIATQLLRNKVGYTIEKPFSMRVKIKEVIKIARIGLPISVQQMIFVVVYWFLIKIVHDYGESAGAAMGIGNRLESFSYLTCYGFSVAASTMVGQNLGAKKPDRAMKCAWGSTGLAMGLALVMTAIFIVFPEEIASIFSDDPYVIGIAKDYLIILGISQTAMALEIVIEGAFSGAGDTIPPMVVMIPGSLARIPLAYYLAYDMGLGLNGVWWTLTITTVIKSVILAGWFWRGKWKLKEV